LDVLLCGSRLLVLGWYLCIRFGRSGVKFFAGLWSYCWLWSQSYLSDEMRLIEALAIDGR
jgi:hypothetical protein